MRILTYRQGHHKFVGISVDGHIYDLIEVCRSINEVKGNTVVSPFGKNVDVVSLNTIDIMSMGDVGVRALNYIEAYIRWAEADGDFMLLRNARRSEGSFTWMPPVTDPALLFGIGGNSPLFFRDKSYQIPAYPRGFIRPRSPNALIGHNQTVTIPAHYDTMRASAELGVVIGKGGKNICENAAMDHVWGYTMVNDMCSDAWKVVALGDADESEMLRDLTIFTQRAATSYYSRSTDQFAAIGPYIISKCQVTDPYNLLVYNKLSGRVRERGYTQAMVNGIERTVSFISRIMTLRPGMILHMGTMGIDGYTIEKDMRLSKEDFFEIEFEKIGSLRCYVNDAREVSRHADG